MDIQVLQTAVGRLVAVYQEMIEKYRQMLALTHQQSEGLQRNRDVRAFVDLLSRKEELCREIGILEVGIAEDKKIIFSAQVSNTQRKDSGVAELNKLMDFVCQFIEKIIRQDHQNQKLLLSIREDGQSSLVSGDSIK